MAKKDLPCRGCGSMMWRSSTSAPEGEAMCLACRRASHGYRGYKRGCRCELCKRGVAESMREYTATRTARDGISQFTQYNMRRAEAEGRVYVPESERMVPCAVCGDEVLKRDPSSSVPALHRDCRNTREGRQVAYGARRAALAAEGRSPKLNRFRRKMERAASGSPASKRVFVQGRCSWCEEQFCAPMGKWCSSKCKLAEKNALRHPERFNPTPRLRREVYERDGWVCGLCDLPIDSSLAWPHKWSASLDHVVPQSHMLIPDHSASNLRAVHLQCNSMRGDGSNMSEDELRSRVSAELGGEPSPVGASPALAIP